MQKKNNENIKVLHIATNDFIVNILLLDKIRCLSKYGYDMDFACTMGRYSSHIISSGYKCKHIQISKSINIFKDLLSIYRTYKYLVKEKYTIVHTHNAKAGFIGRVAAKLARVPIIIHTSHGLPFYKGQNFLEYWLYLLFEKFACNISDYVLSQNYEGLDIMKRSGFRPSLGMGYEGNGIDTVKIEKKIREYDAAKKKIELGIRDDMIIIGYYARLEPIKGYKFFVEAFRSVAAKHSNIVCLIAGEGRLKKDIMRYIKDAGLEDMVKFLNFREDIHEIINITDITVLASKKEGIPRILMESMYFKKPVVATNVLGTKELVIHSETGLLVEYGDVQGMTDSISMLIKDKSLRETFGQAGHDRIKKNFTEELAAERIHSAYKYLLAEKGFLPAPADTDRKAVCSANSK